MKHEKDQEKKKLYEKLIKNEQRKKEIYKTYNKEIEDIKSKKFKEFEEEFKNNENEFCKDEISKFDENKITSFIKTFLKSEKVPKFIVNFLIELIDLNKSEIKNIEHLNILLVGPSGVGKSTLINSILNINIKTGFGLPQTKDTESYESENVPFIRLIDSRGIEKNITAGVTNTFEELKKYIQAKIESKDFDQFIHIIWYC